MDKTQQDQIRNNQYLYYYELAKSVPYMELDGLPYKHAGFVHATLAEYDPVNFNKYGMTGQLEKVVVGYAERIAQTVSNELKTVPVVVSGNILEDTQRRNETMLQLEEIAKNEFVEQIKLNKYVFGEMSQESVDAIF